MTDVVADKYERKGWDGKVTERMTAKHLADELTAFRRALHRRPELSEAEFETTERIRAMLEERGIERLDYPLATGVLAVVRGRRPGPCVAVRADIDALPIGEQTGLPFASEIPGTMHACGHDFHTSAVLGASLLTQQLADSEASFAGTVVFVFQPAEEVGAGAEQIRATGVFDDYHVRAIIGAHNQPLLPAGTIGVKSGPLMASVDEFSIRILGVGGHAAIPERTVDPVLIGAHVVAGLQHIVSRCVSPQQAVVVTVGQFHAGTARNVIPPTAVLEGTVRCLDPAVRQPVAQRLRAFVEQTAQAFGGTAEVDYFHLLPAVVNHPEIAALVHESATEVLGAEHVVTAVPSLAGEDFSIYQQHIPGCFFWIGTGKPDGMSAGWHHPEFDVDESVLPAATEVFAHAAQNLLRHFR